MQRRKCKSYAYGRSMHSADWHVDVTVGAKGLIGKFFKRKMCLKCDGKFHASFVL